MENKRGHAKIGEFKPMDLLACAAAREVRDGEVVFAGTGLPMLAIMLAQKKHAPSAVCIYESGSIAGRPIDLPTSVADARCSYQAAIADGLMDAFGQLQSGRVDLAYLSGAEVDMYGNVNTTFIGGPSGKRLTGSGGNADIHSLAKRSVLIMLQLNQKRRFVEKVSYITSPGWRFPYGPKREWTHKKDVYGPAFRGGPEAVISDMGVYRFDEDGVMYLDTVHPGFTSEDCRANCCFDLNISRVKGETPTPTYEELELLHNVIDPDGIILKK